MFGAACIVALAPKIAFGELNYRRINPEWVDTEFEVEFVCFENVKTFKWNGPPSYVKGEKL